MATRTIVAEYDDADALEALAAAASVATFEFENVPAAVVERLRALGYNAPFLSLEAGVGDYVRNYLALSDPYR